MLIIVVEGYLILSVMALSETVHHRGKVTVEHSSAENVHMKTDSAFQNPSLVTIDVRYPPPLVEIQPSRNFRITRKRHFVTHGA